MKRPAPRHPLRTLALLALGVRLALFLLVRPWSPAVESRFVLAGDGIGYQRFATTLLATGRLALSPAEPPNARRTPGYPLFVAGIYALAGPRPWVVLLVQVALDVASCLLLVVLARRWLPPWPAFLAGVLYALDPFLALYTAGTLLSEGLFVFLLLLATWCLVRSLEAPGAARARAFAALAGLVLGLHVLTRPVSQFLVAVFVVPPLLSSRPARERLVQAAVLLVTFVATLTPTLVRNRIAFGRAELSTSGAYNLLVLNAVPLEMAHRKQGAAAVADALLEEARTRMRADGRDPAALDEFQRSDYWRALALEYLRRDPPGFARVYARGVVNAFANVGTSVFANAFGWPERALELQGHAGPLALVGAFVRTKGPAAIALAAGLLAFLLVTYLGVALGLVEVAKRRPLWPAAAFALAVVAYFVLVTGAAGLVRFRLPAVPFYLPFAGLGLAARFGPRPKDQNWK